MPYLALAQCTHPKVVRISNTDAIVEYQSVSKSGFGPTSDIVEIFDSRPTWHETYQISDSAVYVQSNTRSFGPYELISLYMYYGGNGSGANSGTIYGLVLDPKTGRVIYQSKYSTYDMSGLRQVNNATLSKLVSLQDGYTVPTRDKALMWPGSDSVGAIWYDPKDRVVASAKVSGAQSIAPLLFGKRSYVGISMTSNLTGIAQLSGSFDSITRDFSTGLTEITIKKGEGVVFYGTLSLGYMIYSNVYEIPPGPVQAVDTLVARTPVFENMKPGLYTFLLTGTNQQISMNQQTELEVHVLG